MAFRKSNVKSQLSQSSTLKVKPQFKRTPSFSHSNRCFDKKKNKMVKKCFIVYKRVNKSSVRNLDAKGRQVKQQINDW